MRKLIAIIVLLAVVFDGFSRIGYYVNLSDSSLGYFNGNEFINFDADSSFVTSYIGSIAHMKIYKVFNTYTMSVFNSLSNADEAYIIIGFDNDIVVWFFIGEELEGE